MMIQALCVKDRWESDKHSHRVAHFITADGVRFLFSYYPFAFRFIPSVIYSLECPEVYYKEAAQSSSKNA